MTSISLTTNSLLTFTRIHNAHVSDYRFCIYTVNPFQFLLKKSHTSNEFDGSHSLERSFLFYCGFQNFPKYLAW